MADALVGIPKETSKGAGGIYVVYAAMLSDVTGVTVTDGVASFGSAAGSWKKYILGKQAGSNFTSTPVADIPSGSIFYDQLLTMVFKKNQVSKRNEMKVMGRNELVFIINDNNAPQSLTGDCTVGELYFIGATYCTNEGGAELNGGGIATGAQLGEPNNMTMTFGVRETFPPLAISEANYLEVVAGTEITP